MVRRPQPARHRGVPRLARLPALRPHALLAGVAGAGGRALLALGLFTPFASAAIFGVMLSAIVAAHLRKGLWVTSGGYEYPLEIAAVSLALAFTGRGAYSLDAALGLTLRGLSSGLLALALGVASGLGVLALRRRPEPIADQTMAEAA